MNFERINDCLLLSFETDIFYFKWKLGFIHCPLFIFWIIVKMCTCYSRFPTHLKVKLVQFRYLRLQQIGCSNGTVIDKISTKIHGVLWVAAN